MKCFKKGLLILASAFLLGGCEAGPAGPKGDKGDTGVQGPQGPAGTNGTDGINGTNGTNGKSAFEIYCEAHPEYKGTEEDWINEFCKKDETDYTSYENFEFTSVVYGGVKGYTATYIGTSNNNDLVIPSTFNNEPVLGFKFGFMDYHDLMEDPDVINPIRSVYVPSSVKYLAINRESEYAERSLSAYNTTFIFSGSIEEIAYSNYFFIDVCFDGSHDELLETNLISKLPYTNFYTKDEHGDYQKTVDNADRVNQVLYLVEQEINKIRDEKIPDHSKFYDDDIIQVPSSFDIEFEGKTITVPLKISVDGANDYCYSYNQELRLFPSKLPSDIGYQEYGVNFIVDLFGMDRYAGFSVVTVSKVPNAFKLNGKLFKLGDVSGITKQEIISFNEATYQIEGLLFYEDGTSVKTAGIYDKHDECTKNVSLYMSMLSVSVKGEYGVRFDSTSQKGKFNLRIVNLDNLSVYGYQSFLCAMQESYGCYSNRLYVKSGESVTIPEQIHFTYGGQLYNADLTGLSLSSSGDTAIKLSGNILTFDLGEKESAAGAMFFKLNFGSEQTSAYVLNIYVLK